jgi:hypothetical protein
VKLEYPTTSPSDTIDIPDINAEMGNAEMSMVAITVSNNRVTRTSKYELTELILQLTRLTSAQSQTIMTFYVSHLGELIRYTDHNSKAWDVMIVEMSETDDDDCNYSLDFSLEGVAV